MPMPQTNMFVLVQTPIQFNSITFYLYSPSSQDSLKGLYRPDYYGPKVIYDTPLALAPLRARNNALNLQGGNLEDPTHEEIFFF